MISYYDTTTSFTYLLILTSFVGSCVCFSHLDQLRPEVLSCFGELIHSVVAAIANRFSSVNIIGEELSVDHSSSCFATVRPSVRVNFSDENTTWKVPHPTFSIPDNILSHFRIVSLAIPSLRISAEVILLSNGIL